MSVPLESCAAPESDADGLYRVFAVKVQHAFKGIRRDEIAERAYEVLDETARRALARLETIDPTRSVFAWLVGVGIHVLSERVRGEARQRRQVTGTDLGAAAWASLLGRLERGAGADAVGDTIDLHEAMGRLDPRSRHSLECRFFRGLDGEELAQALGRRVRERPGSGPQGLAAAP